MADKTMPETLCVRVDAAGVPYIEDTSDGNCHIGFAYIRADLLQGDPNEPLEYGQRRWVKIEEEEAPWEIALVLYNPAFSKDLFFFLDNESFVLDQIALIGPVIRPPIEEDD